MTTAPEDRPQVSRRVSPETPPVLPDCSDAALHATLQGILDSSPDIYAHMNALRDWVNAHILEVELYLEDVWNETVPGETHFEYLLRSRRTLNEIGPLAHDVYLNHQDARGVWHLDDYQHSVRHMRDPQVIIDFVHTNRG